VRKYAVFLGVFSLFLVACGVPEEQYDAVVAERDSLQSSLLELEDTLEIVITQNDTLEIDLDALTTQNHMNAAKIDELETTRVTLSANNLELAGDVAGLETNIYDIGILNSSFEAKIEELGSEVEELTSDNLLLVDQARMAEAITTEFQIELAELRPLVDDEELLREMGELREERDQLLSAITTINTVSAELAGGIYPSYWSRYTCTRSMVPLLDCGDAGIYVANPTAAQIRMGDVVTYLTPSFTREGGVLTCQYPADATHTIHRVVAIRTLGVTKQYQTKGDAEVGNDLCWIPHASVHGKLIRVLHDVRPEDDIFVEEYDLALNRYRRLKREHNKSSSEYENHLNYYNVVVVGYYSGEYTYNSVLYTFNRVEDARIELNALTLPFNKALDELNRIRFETFGI